MAKQEQGFMGTFSGKLGPVVGYMWRGRWCMRSLPTQVRNPRSPMQVAHRELFKAMVQFAGRQRLATHIGLRESAVQLGMTESNRFVQLNSHAFGWDEGVLNIDYATLCFAEGTVAPVAFGTPTVDEDMVLSVDFEKNPMRMARADGFDHVMVYALCPDADNVGIVSLPVYRKSRRLTMALPDEWKGLDVYLYGWAQDGDGHTSMSVYIGCANSEQHNAEGAEDDGADTVVNEATDGGVVGGIAHADAHDAEVASRVEPPPLGE